MLLQRNFGYRRSVVAPFICVGDEHDVRVSKVLHQTLRCSRPEQPRAPTLNRWQTLQQNELFDQKDCSQKLVESSLAFFFSCAHGKDAPWYVYRELREIHSPNSAAVQDRARRAFLRSNAINYKYAREKQSGKIQLCGFQSIYCFRFGTEWESSSNCTA